MEKHKKILAILYIISGSLQILGMIIMSTLISIFLPLIFENAVLPDADENVAWIFLWIVPFIKVIAVCVVLFLAIPSIIAGWGLLNQKKWALTLAVILGCFKLFSFPIGTALGIYTFWVYLQERNVPQEQIS